MIERRRNDSYLVVCNQRQFASRVTLPAVVVQVPPAAQLDHESDGWVSAVCVPICWAYPMARKDNASNVAAGNIANLKYLEKFSQKINTIVER